MVNFNFVSFFFFFFYLVSNNPVTVPNTLLLITFANNQNVLQGTENETLHLCFQSLVKMNF